MPVHNHGTEEGKGLACRETLVNGKLKGECLRQPEDLRARIGRIVRAAVDSREVCYPVALEVADAVLAELDAIRRERWSREETPGEQGWAEWDATNH